MKPVFLYALYCGSLYGTERMALHTLDGLRDELEPVLFAPPGEGALAEASRLGIQAVPFHDARELALRLRPFVARHDRIAFAATGVSHSMIFGALNLLYRRKAVHLHLIHGGSDERDSYGRKKTMNGRDVRFIAVSDFVRQRLVAHGVNPGQITVVGNFLPDARIRSAPRRPAFSEAGVQKVVIVSRVEAVKRVSLVLDALDRRPELGSLSIRILGTGRELDTLRERARRTHPNVAFEGFCGAVDQALASSDLLLHTCAVEPFGLAILEAMAAGIPVLAPDQGGAAGLVEPGVSGFHFRADDADALADALTVVRQTTSERLNAIVAAADARLTSRYSSSAGLDNYRGLFADLLR